MTTEERLAEVQDRVSHALANPCFPIGYIGPWQAVYREDVPWLLRLVKARTEERDALRDDYYMLLDVEATLQVERERDAKAFLGQVKVTEGFQNRVRELESQVENLLAEMAGA